MTLAVIDTSVFVDHLRGDRRATTALVAHRDAGGVLAGSVLTRFELLSGEVSDQRDALVALLGTVSWIDVDLMIADRAGSLARRFRRSHVGIDAVDFVIAATAIEVDGVVWTRNHKRFPMFSDLPRLYE